MYSRAHFSIAERELHQANNLDVLKDKVAKQQHRHTFSFLSNNFQLNIC